MNFRRQPFQFSSIDPLRRQAELQRRFGIPSSEMVADCLNPNVMDPVVNGSSSLNGSPRLQHRVPIFHQNGEQGISDQKNVDNGYKPKVRVVPIHIEGVDDSQRYRSISGPTGRTINNSKYLENEFIKMKPWASEEPSCQTGIPIKVELTENKSKKIGLNNVHSEPVDTLNINGCSASKEPELNKNVQFEQIEAVINKLKLYKDEVEKFSGSSKDKQYRYLDEMLTRCMLDLDNVETLGMDNIRKARKEAVKQVQFYVDLLDSKISGKVEKMDCLSNLVQTTNSEEEKDFPPVPVQAGEMEIVANENTSLTEATIVSSETVPSVCQTDLDIRDGSVSDPNGTTVINVEMQDSEIKCGDAELTIKMEELNSENSPPSSNCEAEINPSVSLPCVVSESADSDKICSSNKVQSDIVIAEVENDSVEICEQSVGDCKVQHSNDSNISSSVDVDSNKITI